ncbi:MAG: flagellar hook protein FlgE [Campylobacterales bacterium]|nr:flagellar hook protein FlgE [Campylobacterales bacterium]
MMTQGYYTGISGMKTYQEAINVTADNLANISTIGFRATDTQFANLYERSINTVFNQQSVGLGARVDATGTNQEIGSLMMTDRSTDLALADEGWFGIKGADDVPFYTRAGNFTFSINEDEKLTDLVTPEGYHVLGTMAGNFADGVLTKSTLEVDLADVAQQQPLIFPRTLKYPAEPTSKVDLIGNIGTDDELRVLSASIVDSNGDRNSLKVEFTKVDPQVLPGSQWNATAIIKNSDGETIGEPQNGVVEFEEDGSLKSSTLETIDNNGTAIDINFGSGFDGVASIANTNITSSSVADGKVSVELKGYEINQNGEVVATFTNGMQSSMGKIAVYHFQNDQGLDRISGTLFKSSSNSGEPIFYKDANGKNITGTSISNFHLENSNMRMEVGLTELIIYQRAYDANSKAITTADQMMQKALQMDA